MNQIDFREKLRGCEQQHGSEAHTQEAKLTRVQATLRTEGACGAPRSQRLRDTTGPTLQSSKTSSGLTKSWDDPKTAGATVSPTFHTYWREVMKFENVSSQKSGRSIVIDFQMVTIQTGRYGNGTQESKT